MLNELVQLLDRFVTAYERDVAVRIKCATVSVVDTNDDIAPPPPPPPTAPILAVEDSQPTKRGRKAAAPKAPEQTPVAPADQKPELSRDAVRERIIGLSSVGLRSQILGILKTMGYDRLSLVPNERLGELSQQLDGLDPAKAGEPEVF